MAAAAARLVRAAATADRLGTTAIPMIASNDLARAKAVARDNRRRARTVVDLARKANLSTTVRSTIGRGTNSSVRTVRVRPTRHAAPCGSTACTRWQRRSPTRGAVCATSC